MRKDNLRWLWQYYKKYQIRLVILVAVSMGLNTLLTMNPKLISRYVSEVLEQGDTFVGPRILLTIVVITMVVSIGRYFYVLRFQRTSQQVVFQIRAELYDKIQHMEQAYIKENRTGTLLSRMIGDTEAIMGFLAFTLQEILVNLILFIVISIKMFVVSPIFFVCYIGILPIFIYVGSKHSKEVRPTFVHVREQYARLNTVVQENISGNRVVRAFMNNDHEFNKFDQANKGFRDANLASVKVWSRYVPFMDISGVLMNAILLLIGGILYSRSAINMADIVQIAAYIVLLEKPMRSFGWSINKIEQLFASIGKIREIMALVPTFSENLQEHNKKREAKVLNGDIEFKQVSFDYGDGKVIEDFNLQITKGKSVALIGATGSGKSTIIDLLGRFYEVTSGEIWIDGHPIGEYDLQYLRSQMAVSMQNVFLFSDTIENNIRYGVSQANDEDVMRVADISGVHEFVDKMPDKYETVIGENGVGLSGGQKQRIALARALIKEPAILILDDTTSSVDMETEYAIYQGLKGLKGKPTTIFIAHRISSIKHADEIIVMDKGRIVERGSHKQLMHHKGYYYQVLKNQMGDFDLELAEKELRGGASA